MIVHENRLPAEQTILMKYHALFFRKLGKISQNFSSAAVVIGALRVNVLLNIHWSDHSIDLQVDELFKLLILCHLWINLIL